MHASRGHSRYSAMVRLACPGGARPWVARRAGGESLLRGLLRQAVHVGRQQMHFVIAEEVFLGGHLAAAAIAQGLLNLSKAGTVEPDSIGQVGCAHGWLALGVSTMTECTICGEDVLTCGNVYLDSFRVFQARQAAHVTGDIADACFAMSPVTC